MKTDHNSNGTLVLTSDSVGMQNAAVQGVGAFTSRFALNGSAPSIPQGRIVSMVSEGLTRLMPHRIKVEPQAATLWNLYYSKAHAIDAHCENIEVPLPPPYPCELVLVHEALATAANRCAAACQAHLLDRFWQFQSDLDTRVYHGRAGTYGLWVARVEDTPWVEGHPVLSPQFFQNRGISVLNVCEALLWYDYTHWVGEEFPDAGKKVVCSGTVREDHGIITISYTPVIDKVNLVKWEPEYPISDAEYRIVVTN